jgi:hypothetical protein
VRLTTDKGQEAIAEAIAAGVLAHLAVGRTVAAQGGATLPGA